MNKYEVPNMAKTIKPGRYIYPGGVEYMVTRTFKAPSNLDSVQRAGPTTLWWVEMANEEETVTRPRADVARDMINENN